MPASVQPHELCAPSRPGVAHCLADVMMPTAVTALGVKPLSKASVTYPNPVGWTPAALASVYGIHWGAAAGAAKTIAIVDAYDSPTIDADLATFSTQYGLPQCTVANGCFTKLNQNGGAGMPATDVGWALEINLDVEWAHAIAPGAKIVLVEASSASFGDLMTAENTARNSGAQVISNSWGGGELNGETDYDSAWAPLAGQTIFFVGRRQRCRRRVPLGRPIDRVGRRHQRAHQRQHRDRERVERWRRRLQPLRDRYERSSARSATRPKPVAAPSAQRPTCRPLPTRRPASACTPRPPTRV